MEKMGRKRIETRRKILDVSKAYFTDYGYRDTLISDIAKHCRLDRRTIYRYFPSKESLLIHLTAELFDGFTKTAMELMYDEGLTPYQKLEQTFEFYFDYITKNPQMIQFLGMVDVYVGTSMYDRDEFTTLDQHGKRLDVLLEVLIREGQEKGCIRKDFSALDYAVTINNSLIAMSTRTAIYLPNTILLNEGYAWKLLRIQGQLLLESLKVHND